jgi:hypothetical protein
MATEPAALTLKVVHVDPDSKRRKLLGEIEYGAQGKLRVLAAADRYRDYLTGFVNDLNAKKAVNVPAPPPPGRDAEEAGRFARAHERGSPDFLQALKDYVRYFYGIILAGPGDPDPLHEEPRPQVKV